MVLRVVGAGLPRTGTYSLRIAMEYLLGGRCYHMSEVLEHPEHAAVWQRAALGEPPDWAAFLGSYVASVDFPAAAFWPELARTNPEAIVLLSTRNSPQAWFESIDATIGARIRESSSAGGGFLQDTLGEMMADVSRHRFTEQMTDPEQARAAYERHNAEVRAAVASDRLVDWQPGDGWEPICTALGLAVPTEPFPYANARDDFLRTAAFHAKGPGSSMQ